MMKVLALNGSPNEKGVTYTALQLVAQSLRKENIEVEIIHIGKGKIEGCVACRYCRTSGTNRCIIDDEVNEVRDRLLECDGFIIGAPAYFCGIPGPAKAFLDRLFYPAVSPGLFRYKVATAVVALRRSGGVSTLQQLYHYFTPCHIIGVPTQYHNILFGNTAEDALADVEGCQTMGVLGENMAWLLKSLAYSKNAISAPEAKARVRSTKATQ